MKLLWKWPLWKWPLWKCLLPAGTATKRPPAAPELERIPPIAEPANRAPPPEKCAPPPERPPPDLPANASCATAAPTSAAATPRKVALRRTLLIQPILRPISRLGVHLKQVAPFEPRRGEHPVEAFGLGLRLDLLRAGDDHRAHARRDAAAVGDGGGRAQVLNPRVRA